MSKTKWGSFTSDLNKVDSYFKEYVFGFMKSDIQREIRLCRSGKAAGNFLCALGLLCYTEAMGFIIKGEKSKNHERFDAFFTMMGKKYQNYLEEHPDVYDTYRNKMAHAYFATDCEMFMVKDGEIKKYLNGNAPMGLGVLPSGKYYFCVEKYSIDFNRACRKLYREIMSGELSGGYLTTT